MDIRFSENGIHVHINIDENKDVRLYHFSSLDFDKNSIEEKSKSKFRILELQATGYNQNDHRGAKHTATSPADLMKYKEHKDYRNEYGRKLELVMEYEGLEAVVHYQFYDGISVVRSWSEVCNNSDRNFGLEYISSFTLTGIVKEGQGDWDEKGVLYLPHNAWKGEMQWKRYGLDQLGLRKLGPYSSKRISVGQTGTWSTAEYLPMGYFENTKCKSCLFWQIENNGSWHWEISDIVDQLYLKISGPNETENQWWKDLKPGQRFVTVPTAIGTICGGFEEAMAELTKYRRIIRRKSKDNEKLPVIFNDYMNCLWAKPTTEKLLPLIDVAAEVGCEYFCIDAGWYSPGGWWDSVGEWLSSAERFPNGIEEPIKYIRDKGMIPGLWLELESMGMNCPLVQKVSDDWFFKRHGEKIINNSRLQLDFRNPEVIKHADSVVDRLVNDYGVGYIKMDYNVDFAGTDHIADSPGDGLLEHNRAYLKWLDNVFKRYPDLVIENCASGGLRMDYALLSRHSIQSISDNIDYKRFAVLAAASPTALTPEQSACWSYPLDKGDNEEVIFNMVNGMMMRIYQSGHLVHISDERKGFVRQGIEYYKNIRKYISQSLPFWPLGIPDFSDTWVSLGLKHKDVTLVAVWRLEGGQEACRLPIKHLRGMDVKIELGYPDNMPCKWEWSKEKGILSVTLPAVNSARIFNMKIN